MAGMAAKDRGSVRFHRNGWEIRLQVDGDRITRRVKAPNTRAGRRLAEDELDRLMDRLRAGSDGMTIDGLLDHYETARSAGWSPSTRLSHATHVKPVRAAYGDVEVSKLTAQMIEEVNAGWIDDGKAPSTVRRRHSILAAALAYAERNIIAVSPARQVELPKIVRDPIEVMDLGEVLACIAKITHLRLRTAARLSVATGVRRGELLALRWTDVDLEARSVRVTRALARGEGRTLAVKGTKNGTVKVIAIDERTASDLRAWRKTVLAESLRVGGGSPPADSPVFPSPSDPAEPWHPEQLTKRWVASRDGIGLNGVRWHDLRHLHATALLGAGIPAPTVAARLGWTTTQMLDTYGHAIPAHDQLAADVISKATKPASGS
jgi:integrase